MNTVTSIDQHRARRATRISVGELERELRVALRTPEVLNVTLDSNSILIEEVELLASDQCVRRLELAQRRERFEREMAAEEADLNDELEHAVYLAFMAGVPESALYELDTRTADALTNAIRKAQAQA